VIGKTGVAARLLRYTEKEKAGGTEPRVLYSEGIRCRVPTAEREFAAVRRVYGKQGAKRKVPAKYQLPEPGEVATHVRRARPNGRKYWAVAGGSTSATHVRHEGEGYVDEIQAVHVIVSFGLDEVNPDDPEQVRLAFEFVTAMMTRLYPGVQMKLVGQADGLGEATPGGSSGGSPGGSSGRAKFHVHVVQNAVVVEQMEVDGQVWEAGRKMSGALTDINRLRERTDQFIAHHGAEYGVEQKLPSVKEQKAEKRKTRDRRMATKGEISNHDIIRGAFEDAMDDDRCINLDTFIEVMSEHDVTVNHRVARAGKPGETHALSYRLDEMKTPVRGTTLGDHYAFESAIQQLGAIASGQERERRPQPLRAGTPKLRPVPTADEITAAQATVERLARKERLAQADDQAAAHFFLAYAEDPDAAVEATVRGDLSELSRLAKSSSVRETRQRAHRVAAANGKSQHGDSRAPMPPTPVVAPALGELSLKERIRIALLEVQEHANAEAHIASNAYLETKLRAPERDIHIQASPPPEQTVSAPTPRDDPSDSTSSMAQTVQESPRLTSAAFSEIDIVLAKPTTQDADKEANDVTEKWRRISERNRRLALPAVSPDAQTANQAMAPEQRERRLKHPELFDDAKPVTRQREQEPEI